MPEATKMGHQWPMYMPEPSEIGYNRPGSSKMAKKWPLLRHQTSETDQKRPKTGQKWPKSMNGPSEIGPKIGPNQVLNPPKQAKNGQDPGLDSLKWVKIDLDPPKWADIGPN